MQVILTEEEYNKLKQKDINMMDLYDIASTLVKRFLREHHETCFIFTIGVNNYDDVLYYKFGDYELKLIKKDGKENDNE